MSRRGGSIHVATTARAYKGKVYQTHLLRRSYRDGNKVRHETLGNISHLPSSIIELIRGALRGVPYVPASQAFEIIRSLPHGHVAAVLGSLRKLGLEKLIASRPSRERDLAIAMMVARIVDPASKLATARGLCNETQFTSLAKALGIEAARTSEDDLYAAMDWLGERQSAIEGRLAQRHLSNGSLVLYDLTSIRYTGRKCPLAKMGRRDREGRKRFLQVAIGLVCTDEGCPVAVEVFEGNVSDQLTLKGQVEKVVGQYGLERVVFVGDRGIVTEKRIRKDLEPVEGLRWIGALRAPAIRKLAEAGSIQQTLFDERDLVEITSPDFPGERLIVCRNPLLAEERARVREELLRATEQDLDEVVSATMRPKRKLRGEAKIGIRVGKVINGHKVAKHFKISISAAGLSYSRDQEKIREEAALDGIYVIRTNTSKKQFGSEDAVRAYKDLASVERAFRCMKTVDLKVRPLHHRLEKRVRAHVFLCMLAYYVEWHMRRELAPMIFDDEERELADALRESIVAPAERSPSAEAKARTKRTAMGEPVHSFQTLLTDLATIARNRVRPKAASSDEAAEFDILTTPTPLQQRALDLLGVSLAL